MDITIKIDAPELDELIQLLRDYYHFQLQLHRAIGLKFVTAKGEFFTMLQLTDIQSCRLTIQPVDAKGNPAPIDGKPEWSVSDSTVLSLAADDAGLGATITASGPLGPCQVNVSADADLGTGVTTITGTLDVTVVASEATTLNISAEAPTP